MKILQLCNKIPYPPKDGGSIATFNLTKSFAALEQQVDILAINTSKHYVDLQKISKEIAPITKINGVYINTETSFVGAFINLLFSRKPYNAQRFISKKFADAIKEQLQNSVYDIIQLEGLYLIPYVPIIRQYSNALISYRAHNVEHEIWERTAKNTQSRLKRRYITNLSNRIKQMEVAALNTYDVILPITQRDAFSLEKMGNLKPVHITPTGIDTQNIIPKNSDIEYPSLFHIGSLDWTPNQEGLVWFVDNCWYTLNKQFPDLKFYIAGRNAPDWLISKFHKKNIVYCGEVDDAQAFMQNKAIMVVPLFSGSGMRIKIIEGMALGKTIITTTIGSEGIFSTHRKNILLAETKEQFIEEISEIINNKSLFQLIEKNSIRFIRKYFDNIEITKSLIEFYTSQLEIRNQISN